MERLSRRQVLVRGAAAAGGIAGLGLLEPAVALARGHGNPNPIPGGLDESFTPVPSDPFIHVLAPGLGPQLEMATITDFKGVIARRRSAALPTGVTARPGTSTPTCVSCKAPTSIGAARHGRGRSGSSESISS